MYLMNVIVHTSSDLTVRIMMTKHFCLKHTMEGFAPCMGDSRLCPSVC